MSLNSAPLIILTEAADRYRKTKPLNFQAVDKHVGLMVRQRRKSLGLPLKTLADAIGVSYQQLQKYESGINRISASRLLAISEILDRPLEYFFESAFNVGGGKRILAVGDSEVSIESSEVHDLINSYSQIADKSVRKKIRKLLSSLVRGI